MTEHGAAIFIGLVVLLIIVGIGVVVMYNNIPASEQKCQMLDGTPDYIHRWCDCDIVWPGNNSVMNKSHTECHAKNITEWIN